MNREELYFPSVDDIEELVASFHALEVMGQIVVIKGISTKEEYGFVTWNAGYDTADSRCIVISVIFIEQHICMGRFIEWRDVLCYLYRVSLDELRRQFYQRITESIGGFYLFQVRMPKEAFEIRKQREVTSGESVDGLPVISHTEKLGLRFTFSQGLQKSVSIHGYILELIYNDILIRTLLPFLTELGSFKDDVRKILLLAILHTLHILLIHWADDIINDE